MKDKLIPERKIKTKKIAKMKEERTEKKRVFIFEFKLEKLAKINQKRKSREKLTE